jgi:hypothetical protein
MRRRFLPLAALIALPLLYSAPARADNACASAIGSNFNGTAIPAGRTIWLSSVFKASGLGPGATTIRVVDQSIDLDGTDVSVPDAVITFTPLATVATTTFDAAKNAWITTVPKGLGGNAFSSGVAVPVATGLPGGLNPVTWRGTFFADVPGVKVNWQWAAAVYTAFASGYDALAVKPTDDNKASLYANSDHAGTPENVKAYVAGGARGGGGSNFTGSYSATGSVVPCPTPPDPDPDPDPTAT